MFTHGHPSPGPTRLGTFQDHGLLNYSYIEMGYSRVGFGKWVKYRKRRRGMGVWVERLCGPKRQDEVTRCGTVGWTPGHGVVDFGVGSELCTWDVVRLSRYETMSWIL